jgi:hypothetical protein
VVVDKNADFRAKQENDILMWIAEIRLHCIKKYSFIKNNTWNSKETFISIKLYTDILFLDPSLIFKSTM